MLISGKVKSFKRRPHKDGVAYSEIVIGEKKYNLIIIPTALQLILKKEIEVGDDIVICASRNIFYYGALAAVIKSDMYSLGIDMAYISMLSNRLCMAVFKICTLGISLAIANHQFFSEHSDIITSVIKAMVAMYAIREMYLAKKSLDEITYIHILAGLPVQKPSLVRLIKNVLKVIKIKNLSK